MKKYCLQRNHKLFLLLLFLWAFLWLTGLSSLPSVLRQTRLLTVVSGSMEPRVATGTIIAVNQSADKLFVTGDIITFRQDELLITHRIIDVSYDNGFYYTTQGDANLNPDPTPVRPAEVMGRVVFVVPSQFVPLLRLLRSPLFLIALLLLIRLRFAAIPKPAQRRFGTAKKGAIKW